jgi:hypothetical protein
LGHECGDPIEKRVAHQHNSDLVHKDDGSVCIKRPMLFCSLHVKP